MGMQNPYAPPGSGMPPGAWPSQGYGPPPGAGYQFNPDEQRLIGSTAIWARILGIVLIASGAVALLGCNPVSTALNVTVGVLLLVASGALASVPRSQGNDVDNMMTALSRLAMAFRVRVILTLVAVVLYLLVIGLIVALVGAIFTHK